LASFGAKRGTRWASDLIFDRDLLSVVISQLGNLSLDNLGSGMDFSLLLPPSKIMIPFTMGNMKIEPEVGWMRYSSKTVDKDADTEVSGSSSAYKFGVGIFSVKTVKKTDFYFGGRIGLVMSSSTSKEPSLLDPEDETEISSSRTHLFFGPCIGGEYYISENFSFGGEAQLIYTKLGQPTVEIDGKEQKDNDIESSASMIDTRYMFIFRWYR
jgi:hypothetical protein